MGQRKSGKELELIKQENNVMELYSWSRYNTWERDTFEYFLKYVIRAKEDRRNSIYGASGGYVHDLLEDFYLGKINQKNMPSMYEDEISKLELCGFRFDRSNKEKNDKISVKYNACNKHFFENFTPINQKDMKLEEFILIKVGAFMFQGYVDLSGIGIDEHKDKMIITDFKTSSMYAGDKIIKERGQLLLYALGKIQQGWNIDDIVIGWLFTKYAHVDVPQKDGFRTRIIERNEIGSKLLAGVKAQLKKCRIYTEEEANAFADQVEETLSLDNLPEIIFDHVDEVEVTAKNKIKSAFKNKVRKVFLNAEKYSEEVRDEIGMEMIMTNSIDCVPEEVRKLFTIRDCFVEILFEQKDIDELQEKIIKFICESEKMKIQYSKTNDDNLFYQEVDQSSSYFLSNLCGYSSKIHKPYAEYLEKRRIEKGLLEDDSENENTEEQENDEMAKLYAELGIDMRD